MARRGLKLFTKHGFVAVIAALVLSASALSPAEDPETVIVDALNTGIVTNFQSPLVLGAIGIIPYGRGSTGSVPYSTVIQGKPYLPGTGSCFPFDATLIPNPSTNPIYILDERIGDCPSFVRVMNAVNAGAAAVILIANTGLPGIISSGDTLNPVSASYFYDRVRIPVGRVSPFQGDNLKPLQDAFDAFIRLDFNTALHPIAQVEVQIWLDADDSCGYPCIRQQEFLVDIAKVARQAASSDSIKITPHWLLDYQCRTPGNDDECKKHCVGNNYCYYSIATDQVSTDADGDVEVIEETIRRICLWNYLNEAGLSSVFWDYIINFANDCKSEHGHFNEKCSKSSFDKTGRAGDKTKWEQCYQAMEKSDPIQVVEDEINLAKSQVASDGSQDAYIDRNLRGTVRINDHQFRGALRANFVMDAACGSLLSDARSVCNIPVPGVCAASDAASQACLTPDNVAAHKTKCFREDGINAVCVCEDGYRLNEEGVCEDIDECAEEGGIICPYEDTRNVCVNTVGSYMCQSYPDVCDLDTRGGCWQSADRSVNACQDNLEDFRNAVRKNLPLPPPDDISSCSCDAVGGDGCYKTVKNADGTESCKKVNCVNVGALVGGLLVALLVICVAVVLTVLYVRKRKEGLTLKEMLPFGKRGSARAGGSAMHGTFAKYDAPDVEMAKPGAAPSGPMAAHPVDLKIALEKVDLAGQ